MIAVLNVVIWVAIVVGALAVVWLVTHPRDDDIPFGYRRWDDIPPDDLLDLDEAVKRHPSSHHRKH